MFKFKARSAFKLLGNKIARKQALSKADDREDILVSYWTNEEFKRLEDVYYNSREQERTISKYKAHCEEAINEEEEGSRESYRMERQPQCSHSESFRGPST